MLDLFPFLSIMLCVVGVLAFVQVLMAMSGSPRVKMVGDLRHDYQVGYQVVCVPEGAVLMPPADGLGPLIDKAQGADQERLRAVRDTRRQMLSRLRSGGGATGALARTMDDASVLEVLRELKLVNTVARTAGVPYEEFLLFGVRPGGGRAYHRFRAALERVEFAANPRSGLIPLDGEWKLVVPAGGGAP
jgi:hypothetical protein